MDIQDYVDSIYINGIDGELAGYYNTGSSWTYRINGELVNKGIQGVYLSDGDKVEVYFAPFGTETVFASLSANKTSVEVGDEVKVKATGKTNGSSIENISGANILINGTRSHYVTDSNGEVNIKFNDIGTYEVSIFRYKDGIKDLVNFEPLKIWVSGISSKLSSSEFTEGEEHEISITSTVQNIDDGSKVTFDLIKYKKQ